MRVRTWAGRLVVAVTAVAAVFSLPSHRGGLQGFRLAASWQLIDLGVLGDDPLGSVWYLHTQPPLHNLLVGIVAWLPLPIAGTLFAGFAAALAVTGVLLHDILRRWGLGPLAATVVAALAISNPALTSTIDIASYEIPVAMLIMATLWAAQRHLEDPGRGWLVVASVTLTAGTLTRSLLHPLWIVVVLGLLVAVRRTPRRQVLAAAAIPLVLVGGWMLKNHIVFGTATLSSWSGFNLQRGVVATMGRDQVRAAVQEGDVSPLALKHPWGWLEDYEDVAEPCRPQHDRPATARPWKQAARNYRVANFNHECFMPLYAQASDDARTLALRYPMRYLATRRFPLVMTYDTPDGECYTERCTWMDRLYLPVLGRFTTEIPMNDWNLPLLGRNETFDIRPAGTLAVATVFVLGRTVLAVVRLRRSGWRSREERERWPDDELLWLLAAVPVLMVVGLGSIVEFGENARFRAAIDPLLVGLPLAVAARAAAGRLARRRARRAGGDDGGGGGGEDDVVDVPPPSGGGTNAPEPSPVPSG